MAPLDGILSRIPEDIWRMIFTTAITSYPSYPDVRVSPYALHSSRYVHGSADMLSSITSTCRSWRTIACETSVLWQKIVFYDARPPLNSVERVRMWFLRSGSMKLQVDIFVEGNTGVSRLNAIPSTLLSVLAPQFGRISVLNLIELPSSQSPFLCIIPPSLGNFQDLSVPTALTSLRLEGFTASFHVRQDLAQLLDKAPLVESLYVGTYAFRPEAPNAANEPSSMLSMPCLRVATLDAHTLHYLLAHYRLRSPCLVRLCLTGIDGFLAWNPQLRHDNAFLKNNFVASLQVLEIKESASDAFLIRMLSLAGDLRTLALDGCQAGADLLLFISQLNVLPKLKELVIKWGTLEDDVALNLLNSRPNDFMMDVYQCWNTTKRLGAELHSRGQGVWEPYADRPTTWTG